MPPSLDALSKAISREDKMNTTGIFAAAAASLTLLCTTALADGTKVDLCKVYKTHCKINHHCDSSSGRPQCVPDKKKTACSPACKSGEKCEAVQCIKAPCPNQCVKR